MSALGGIYCFEDAIDRRALALLGESLDQRGPDGGKSFCSNHVGMVHRALFTDHESRHTEQPYLSRERYVIAWDGRLDNRDELLAELREELTAPSNTISDVQITMAAYVKWGESFLAHIVGDFALSLWDPYKRHLLLARDPVGTRSLYYTLNHKRLLWASSLSSLLQVSGNRPGIEDEYIAGFLSRGTALHLTPYKELFSVNPGELLTVTGQGNKRSKRFWSPDVSKVIRYKRDEDYEEEFRHLFREAVKCRLRSAGTACAELSGGLDSSSVVCMADQVIASGEAQASGLETISFVSDSSPVSDERRFIGLVETHRGRKTNLVREDDYPMLSQVVGNRSIETLNPLVTSYACQSAYVEIMRACGSRVLLSGIGGDELLWSTNEPSPELADLLAAGRFIQLHRRLKVWGSLLRDSYLRLLLRRAVWPCLPTGLKLRFSGSGTSKLMEWLNPEFVRRYDLQRRMLGPADSYGYSSPGFRIRSKAYLSAVGSIARGHRRELLPCEISYPYLHRPLVEFLLALPFGQLLRPGESRSLMRRSLKGILPEGILKRRGKGHPGEIVCRALAREWSQLQHLFDNPYVVRLGYVEKAPLGQALIRARHGSDAQIAPLITVIVLEEWLRSVVGQSGMPTLGTDTVPEIPFSGVAA